MGRTKQWVVAGVLIVVAVAAPHVDAVVVDPVTDLGTLDAAAAYAADIAANGIAVGTLDLGGQLHGFTYDSATGTMTDVGTPAGVSSAWLETTNGTLAAGYTLGGSAEPFLYDIATGTYTDLTPLIGNTEVTDLNADGLLVGGTFVVDTTTMTATDLSGAIPGLASIYGVNDNGVVVGTRFAPGPRPFMYDTAAAALTDLDIPSGVTRSASTAINNHDQVVGFVELPSGDEVAVLWHNGEMTILDDLSSDAIASDINDAGLVVGRSSGKAFVYDTANGSLAQWDLWAGSADAVAINDSNQVVGHARFTHLPPRSHSFITRAHRLPSTPDAPTVSGCQAPVQLSWSPSQPAEAPVTGYEVLRSGVAIGTTTATTFTDTTPIVGAAYQIVATSSTGNSPPGPATAWSRPGCPATPVQAAPSIAG